MSCNFCKISESRIVSSDDLVVVIRDRYPVSPGHTLIIPRRHVADYFELTEEEHAAMHAMLLKSKKALGEEFKPQGFNVGVNIGRAAGQTIDHVHMHLIPRYDGDMADPRGGVRGVIPEKQKYPREAE